MHNDIYYLKNRVERLEKQANIQDWFLMATMGVLLLVSIATLVNAWN